MQSNIFRKLIILTVLVNFCMILNAQDKRAIPLDMYLIIDGSVALEGAKNDVISWVSLQVIDRILMDGDKITVWNAAEKPEIIYSDTITGATGKNALKDKLKVLDTKGKTADFSAALGEASRRVSQTPGDRLAYTMLITASAEGMEPALSGASQNLFRWFRSEKYERWQVLVVATDIGNKVRQNAQSYMSSLR